MTEAQMFQNSLTSLKHATAGKFNN